jgi:cell wall integrity and stress response component
MLSRLVKTAIAAACLLQFSNAQVTLGTQFSGSLIPTATTTPAMNALTKVGCFSTPTPMVDHGPYTFQSSGNCQPICYDLQQPVMGLVNGTNCWCGALLPPKDSQVDNSSCNTPCSGFGQEMCK